jgi:hypothetical protein
MDKPATKVDALRLLNAVFYTLMERLFEKTCEVTGLDEERKRALRQSMLKPMNFLVIETPGTIIIDTDDGF